MTFKQLTTPKRTLPRFGLLVTAILPLLLTFYTAATSAAAAASGIPNRAAVTGSPIEHSSDNAAKTGSDTAREDAGKGEKQNIKVDAKLVEELAGAADDVSVESADKRYMRFGRSVVSSSRQLLSYPIDDSSIDGDDGGDEEEGLEEEGEKDEEKRYMRFGRAQPEDGLENMDATIDGDDATEEEGRAGEEDVVEADKRYMRFGRAVPDAAALHQLLSERGADKRYMRFGRRAQGLDSGPLERNSVEPTEDKRYMRFGRAGHHRFMRSRDDTNDLAKRYMRFGRRPSIGGAGNLNNKDDRELSNMKVNNHEEEKRYMRFGRSPMTSSVHSTNNKRYMRFGRAMTMRVR